HPHQGRRGPAHRMALAARDGAEHAGFRGRGARPRYLARARLYATCQRACRPPHATVERLRRRQSGGGFRQGRPGRGTSSMPRGAPETCPRRETQAMQTHPRFIQITALAVGIAGAMAFSQAHAAAFLLKENSVKAQGRSMAGAASARGDASVVANNPAVMSTFDKTPFQADLTAIDLSFEFKGGGSAAAGSPLAQPLTGGNGGDAGGLNAVPAMSFIKPLSGQFEYVTLGAMVSAPFGLKTEYDDDWVGR